MGLTINTNTMTLGLMNSMNKDIKKAQKSAEKLASGCKINRAGDDASGLAVSEKMRNMIAALDTQIDTDEDAINLIQTADGYMAEVQSMVERMVELTMKSTNGVLSDHPDRDNLQKEMDQLCGEMDRIATTANFNGIKLLGGSATEKVQTTRITEYPEAIPNSNLLKDADNFNGTLIDNMDEIQTVRKLSEIAGDYVRANGGNRESINGMAVYYASGGQPAIVASKDADLNELKAQLGMEDGDVLNQVETSTFGNVDAYNVQIPKSGFVENDEDGSATASLIGAALDSFKSEHEDLNSMKGKNVFYTTDGLYSFVAPKGSGSIDIQSGFASLGAEVPVKYKSQSILLSYEYPPYYQIPAGQEVTEYVDKQVGLDLKIGVTSTTPDKLNLELWDFHTDHIFESEYEERVTGTRTVFQEVVTPSKNAYASVGGTQNTQREYSYPGSEGGVRQAVVYEPIIERVDTGASTKPNDISTYKKAVAPDISTQDRANANIDAIKKASEKISDMRGNWGAKQNRIEHTINVIATESENTRAAFSRIKDTDMANEIMHFTVQNIISQSAQSLFVQANSNPQEINSLLQ